MQKKVFVRRSSKTALKKQYIPIFYSSAALICTIILCIQSFTGGKNDIFFELLSFKMPFIYGMSDIEDVENDASLSNRSSASDDLVIELLGKSDIKNLTAKSNSEPTILIYHTHTTEAYTQTDGYEYEETTQWRTDDTDKSIVAVGEKLCTLLHEKYGLDRSTAGMPFPESLPVCV